MCEYPSNLCLNLIPKPAGEPVFLVFSKHITSWYNNDRDEGKKYTQVEVAYPRWKFLPQSSINYIIQGEKIVALDEEEKDIKILALQDEPDPDDPEPPVKKKSPVPAQSPQLALPPAPKPTITPKRNTATAPRASSAPHKKKSRSDSAAATQWDNKREIIDLNRLLRESNSDLESARLRVGRLEDQAKDAKKVYEEAIKKMGETIGDQDDLIELKRATYNHFLSKWESDNSENHGDNITPLMRAFPVTLRKYFLTEIEKDKNALV